MLTFTKMNGAGNDFIMVDNRTGSLSLDRATIARICDRHRGIGGDGLLAVESPASDADFRMRYYNADGGEAEMCGNGARCFARFAGRLSGKTDRVSFETIAGRISADLLGDEVRLTMSVPHDLRTNIALSVNGTQLTSHFVNTGVPHAIVFVEDLQSIDVLALGSGIRRHEAFGSKGTNANFIQAFGDGQAAIRTYERGVEDETLACGTGVVAAAIILNAVSGYSSPIGIKVRGGEVLNVGFDRTNGGWENVTLTGPAEFVFEGNAEL